MADESMKLERDKAFSVWMIMDADGYATEIVVTNGDRPAGHHVVSISTFINKPMKKVGESFSFTGPTLAGLPVSVIAPGGKR